MNSSTSLSNARLLDYIEGVAEAPERAEIERALRDDPDGQLRLAQLQHMRSALTAPISTLENTDMLARVQSAIAARTADRRTTRLNLLRSLAVAAACIGLAVTVHFVETPGSEFRSKAIETSTRSDNYQRWAGIRIHRATSDITVERVATTIGARDRLLFSYTNLGPQPFEYLMIFAVDGGGHVYWFYPAYEDPGSDPSSTAIAQRAEQALPDLVEHEFSPGTLAVNALFTHRPLHVLEVEQWLRTGPDGLSKCAPSDARAQLIPLQVAP